VLTVLTLLATLGAAAVFLNIFLNPNSSLNLFPPPTIPAELKLPTLTPTPRGVLPPTWTPAPTGEPTQTETSQPSSTSQPTADETLASETPFPLFTPTLPGLTATPGGMTYILAQGSPVAISSVAFHPDKGCGWMGVAGQVLNEGGAPISTGIVIQLGGTLAGNRMDIPSLTGVAPQYGQAGYEIFLAEEPTASEDTLWVQLLDQAGAPLSDKVYFDTFEACEKNLVFINFQAVR
jgi:hypothetical protein